MGKTTGFKEYKREGLKKRPVSERIKDFREIYKPFNVEKLKFQAARCMNCGTPFCNFACPLGNLAPDFNHMVYKGDFEKAFKRLTLTSSFPEFTGRLCPALCEGSCTLGINRESVTVREIELFIIENAFKQGYIRPNPPRVRTGKKVAIVGSGPSGLAAAAMLNSLGHTVTVFERADEIGGLLRYGIPDFKLEKHVIDRRIRLMEEEGVIFKTNHNIGVDYSILELQSKFDSILLTGGSTIPRDLNIPGRELDGIHFAMEFLTQQNMRVAGKPIKDKEINAKNKTVLIIGGGDTGSDCIGTAIRQGAKEVYQYEIMPKPPAERDASMPWPEFPRTLKTSSSHEEGCIRDWCISTKEFKGTHGKVESIKAVRVEWINDKSGRTIMKEIPGTEFEQKIDLVLLAMGFVHPQHSGMIEELNLKLDPRGNVCTDENYMTSTDGIFSAGDMRTGQSLIVKAINDGRNAAKCMDKYLMRETAEEFAV